MTLQRILNFGGTGKGFNEKEGRKKWVCEGGETRMFEEATKRRVTYVQMAEG